MHTPTHLRVEHLGAAVLGLGDRRPRLSWRLPPGAVPQEAYASRSTAARWTASSPTPASSSRGPADPDLPAAGRLAGQGLGRRGRERLVGAGLVRDRAARPLRLDRPLDRAGRRPSAPPTCCGTRSGSVAPAREARLYATAHGVYETFLNGRRVGDVELAPGYTSYPTTLHVQVYDVGALADGGRQHLGGRALGRLVARAHRVLPGHGRLRQLARLPGPAPRGRRGRHDGPRLGVRPPGRSCRPTSWRGRSRTTGRAPAHGRPSRSPTTTWRPWPTRRRRRPAGWRSCAPSPSPVPGPTARSSTSGRTSTAGCA